MPVHLTPTVRQLQPGEAVHTRKKGTHMKRNTTIGLALAAVLALSAAIGVASGAIPASDGTITACYSKTKRDLRMETTGGQSVASTARPARHARRARMSSAGSRARAPLRCVWPPSF